jgi:hypothetical protein
VIQSVTAVGLVVVLVRKMTLEEEAKIEYMMGIQQVPPQLLQQLGCCCYGLDDVVVVVVVVVLLANCVGGPWHQPLYNSRDQVGAPWSQLWSRFNGSQIFDPQKAVFVQPKWTKMGQANEIAFLARKGTGAEIANRMLDGKGGPPSDEATEKRG